MRTYFLLLVSGFLAADCIGVRADPPGGRSALLVGCTHYPHLPSAFELTGPANDVVMLKRLLTERFQFREQDVVVLVENVGDASLRPTRANIEREFRRLAERTTQGNQVVILLAGHGSQQPADDPNDPEDPEPDGFDEIFLPSDIRGWDGSRGTVENAIVDDELRAWLSDIERGGAAVWIIVDACHAGTMVRGSGLEKVRQVPMELMVPEPELQEARARAARSGGVGRPAPNAAGSGDPRRARPAPSASARPGSASPGGSAQPAHWVAVYACQSSEPTVERPLPEDSQEPQPHGLLTYTINQVLTQTETALTYSELTQAVARQYTAWGRSFPTPLVEGTDRDREVLGVRKWPGRSGIQLQTGDQELWRVNAGALHGLTPGSVLAVYPPAGAKEASRLLGHVRVTGVRTFRADVQPCDRAGVPAKLDLPTGARCELAFVDYGFSPLRLALDVPRGEQGQVLHAGLRALQPELLRWAESPRSPWILVADTLHADWLLRIEQDRAHLLSASGSLRTETDGPPASSPAAAAEFGPVPVDRDLPPWLDRACRRIVRAQGLLRLAAPVQELALPLDQQLDVDAELLRYSSPGDAVGTIVSWQSAGRRLVAGEVIGLRVANRSPYSVDVTLLFIDGGYGISAFFPRPGLVGDNRLAPGRTLVTPRARVTATTTGQEHMVLIAVKAQRFPADFSCLVQPTLERVRGLGDRPAAFDSPLGRLLESAINGDGRTRGAEVGVLSTYALRCISWTTAQGSAKED
jgi:hypothetical protein